MFSIDPSLTFLDAGPERVLSVIESINQPHVAVPQREAQSALGFIVSLGGRGGSIELYIYLWLSRSRVSTIYRFDRGLQASELGEAQQQAVEFCESMGFMMEEIQLRGLSADARRELLVNLPPFQREPAPQGLESSPTLQTELSGPTMNANYDGLVGAEVHDFEELEVLEPFEEEPQALDPAEIGKLARFLVTF